MKFSSSMIALVVFVLGLTAYASGQSAQQCTLECSDLSQINNTTQDVEIQFDASVTIIIAKSVNVVVFFNAKSNLLIAFGDNFNVAFVYKLGADFAIAINIKTGACVKVDYKLTIFSDIDLTILKAAIVKGNTDISGGTNIVQIDISYILTVQYNINQIFISGSADIILSIKTTYGFFFQTCYDVASLVGRSIGFAGLTLVVGFGVVSKAVVQAAQAFALIVEARVTLAIDFFVFIVTEISKTSNVLLGTFITAIKGAISVALETGATVKLTITELIEQARSGVNIQKSLAVGTFTFSFQLTLVKEYMGFVLDLGLIHVDIGYSGKALAVLNFQANIYQVVGGEFIFLYSTELKAGFLIKGGKFVYVTLVVIQSKIGAKTDINSGTLALFVNKYGTVVFDAGKQIALKDFKTALESEAKCVVFCDANGIANGALVYKVFKEFAGSISGSLIFGYSFDIVISLRVTFSLTASYQIDTACYNNLIVAGTAAALKVTTTFASASTVFAGLKVVLG